MTVLVFILSFLFHIGNFLYIGDPQSLRDSSPKRGAKWVRRKPTLQSQIFAAKRCLF